MGGWCFAIVNGRLAEIYFTKKRGKNVIEGYCYVKREDFKLKSEQRYIDEDTAKFRFVYRKGKYREIKN